MTHQITQLALSRHVRVESIALAPQPSQQHSRALCPALPCPARVRVLTCTLYTHHSASALDNKTAVEQQEAARTLAPLRQSCTPPLIAWHRMASRGRIARAHERGAHVRCTMPHSARRGAVRCGEARRGDLRVSNRREVKGRQVGKYLSSEFRAQAHFESGALRASTLRHSLVASGTLRSYARHHGHLKRQLRYTAEAIHKLSARVSGRERSRSTHRRVNASRVAPDRARLPRRSTCTCLLTRCRCR